MSTDVNAFPSRSLKGFHEEMKEIHVSSRGLHALPIRENQKFFPNHWKKLDLLQATMIVKMMMFVRSIPNQLIVVADDPQR